MRVIEPKAAQFNNTRIYIHKRSSKAGGQPDGRYIWIGGIFKLGAPNLKKRQYLGLHNHMVITLSYPDYIHDLIGIAADLPGIEGCGNLSWMHRTYASATQKGGLWYFIPKLVWEVKI